MKSKTVVFKWIGVERISPVYNGIYDLAVTSILKTCKDEEYYLADMFLEINLN